MLTVTNAGSCLLLDWALQSTSTPENLTVRLFKTNVTPAASGTGSSLSDFTACDFTSYVDQTLSRASWSNASTVGSTPTIQYSSTLSWSVGSSQTVYGYVIFGSTSNTLIWGELFATPRNVINGDTITFVPSFTGVTQT